MRIIFILILVLTIIPFLVLSQGVAGEEAKGEKILADLKEKKVSCAELNNDNFEVLGEYFMGQMAGTSHEAMNQMMKQMIGENGEEQMHIVMGKRLSGCDNSASFPQGSSGFLSMMPMMQMMGSWSGSPSSNLFSNMMGNNMMGSFGVWGWLGLIFQILFWIFIIVGILALIGWLLKQIKGGAKRESALEILKERYAKGEITKGEFEEMKKNLIS